MSIVSVALPSIQSGLGTSPAGAQWVVSGYALAFGLALVPGPSGFSGAVVGISTAVGPVAGGPVEDAFLVHVHHQY